MAETEKPSLRQVTPQVKKGCPIYHKPRSRHPPTPVGKRPPWDPTLPENSEGRMRRRKEVTYEVVPVPPPQLECMLARRTSGYSNGSNSPAECGEDVLVCREPYRPAWWCAPRQHEITVKHTKYWGDGNQRREMEVMPNDYRLFYINERNGCAPRPVKFQSPEHGLQRYPPEPYPGAETGRYMATVDMKMDKNGELVMDC